MCIKSLISGWYTRRTAGTVSHRLGPSEANPAQELREMSEYMGSEACLFTRSVAAEWEQAEDAASRLPDSF